MYLRFQSKKWSS